MLVERKDSRDEDKGRRVKRRMSDRISITPNLVECALSKGSKDIVEYFVKEKGKNPSNASDLRCFTPFRRHHEAQTQAKMMRFACKYYEML